MAGKLKLKMELNDKKGWQEWEKHEIGITNGMLERLWEACAGYKKDYQPDETAGLTALKRRMAQHQPAKIRHLSTGAKLLRIAAGMLFLAIGIAVFKNQLSTTTKAQTLVSTTDTVKEITLADGTKVSLNRSSLLNYQTEFAQNERRVELTGEAFFEVKRDETKPFIIKVGDAEVKVLGTSFNVRAYPKEDIFEVYVESGKVKVDIESAKQHVELTKSAVFRYHKSTNKAEKDLDKTGVPIAWHSGVLSFKGQPIPVILDGMERLYGIDFDLRTVQVADCLQTLTVQKGKMDEAIDAFRLSCPTMKFSKNTEGNYRVSGLCCNQ
jgi:transmembrane sensor